MKTIQAARQNIFPDHLQFTRVFTISLKPIFFVCSVEATVFTHDDYPGKYILKISTINGTEYFPYEDKKRVVVKDSK